MSGRDYQCHECSSCFNANRLEEMRCPRCGSVNLDDITDSVREKVKE